MHFTVPADPPGYWPNETTGVLRPVVEKYLCGERLDGGEVRTMRSYLRQWISCGAFFGPDIERLRMAVDQIHTHDDVRAWLERALDAGLDPL